MKKKSHRDTGAAQKNKARGQTLTSDLQTPDSYLQVLRLRAEEQLRKQADRIDDLSKQDIKKLVHELGTYQIELEMQNEELRRAQGELEKSRSQYVSLYDFAPVGYYTFDKNGVILEVSLAGAALLWKEKGFLLNKPFSLFVHRDDQDIFFIHRREVFETHLRRTCELRLKSESSAEIYARLESIPDSDEQGNFTRMRTAMSNITEVKMAEKAAAEKEARYRTIFEGANDGILAYDLQSDEFLFANKRMSELTGYQEEELLKLHVKDLHTPEDLPHVLEQFRKAASGEAKKVKTIPVLRKDRRVIYCDISSSFAKEDEKSILLGFFKDVTEQVMSEERTKHLASFPQLNPNPVMETDSSGKITYYNPAIQTALSGLGMDTNDASVFLPADFEEILRKPDRKTETFFREVFIKDRIFSSTIHSVPQFNAVRIYAHDITDRKKMENAVIHAKEEWEKTFDSVPDLIAILDREYRIVRANRAMAERLGVPAGQCAGLKCFACVHGTSVPPAVCPHKQTMEDGREHTAELHEGRLKGDFLVTTSPLFDETGKITGSVHVARNITERKRAENQIRAALEEKEVLLREVHHRVKNNMTVIFSLLRLQSRHVKDDRDRRLFEDSMGRIKSMALIHEKLYRSKNMAEVNFSNYIKELAGSIFMSYRIPSGRIRLTTDVDNVSLGIDTAIPCGLIVNELLSNSMKYAFPDGTSGELRVALHKISDPGTDDIELIVGDNGTGIPETIDVGTSDSLGLTLVNAFVKQLHGKIDISRENGTEFRIRFSRHIAD